MIVTDHAAAGSGDLGLPIRILNKELLRPLQIDLLLMIKRARELGDDDLIDNLCDALHASGLIFHFEHHPGGPGALPWYRLGAACTLSAIRAHEGVARTGQLWLTRDQLSEVTALHRAYLAGAPQRSALIAADRRVTAAWTLARCVLGQCPARRFMTSPHQSLGRSPIEVVASSDGRVKDFERALAGAGPGLTHCSVEGDSR